MNNINLNSNSNEESKSNTNPKYPMNLEKPKAGNNTKNIDWWIFNIPYMKGNRINKISNGAQPSDEI